MQEVCRAVQGVDDPAQPLSRPAPETAFLGEDGMVGVDRMDDFEDGLFGSPVHLAHEVVAGFFLDPEVLDPIHLAQDNLSTPAGSADGDVGDGLHVGSAV